MARLAAGCGVAVYFLGPNENIGVVRVLADRGFKEVGAPFKRIWYLDLGLKRPPSLRRQLGE